MKQKYTTTSNEAEISGSLQAESRSTVVAAILVAEGVEVEVEVAAEAETMLTGLPLN